MNCNKKKYNLIKSLYLKSDHFSKVSLTGVEDIYTRFIDIKFLPVLDYIFCTRTGRILSTIEAFERAVKLYKENVDSLRKYAEHKPKRSHKQTKKQRREEIISDKNWWKLCQDVILKSEGLSALIEWNDRFRYEMS